MSPARFSRTVTVALVTFATFTDLVAYSICVPVLPDLAGRMGATPTMIGLLFASFGSTVLIVSIPMGAAADRIGRRLPLVAGMAALAVSTVAFAYADSMASLFAARLVQGAADAVTWVVGLAIIADEYGPAERGRAMGIAVSGATFGFMVGPTLGGWLYQMGGAKLPFLAAAGLAMLAAAAFLCIPLARPVPREESTSFRTVLRAPDVIACALAVVAVAGTLAMLEPVFALFLARDIHLGPARIGLVFGLGALTSTIAHPIMGRLTDRFGGRRLMILGLFAVSACCPSWAGQSASARPSRSTCCSYWRRRSWSHRRSRIWPRSSRRPALRHTASRTGSTTLPGRSASSSVRRPEA